jgi:hypothetical protein
MAGADAAASSRLPFPGGRNFTGEAYPLRHIEAMCHQLSWGVDEQSADAIVLHFNDPVLGIRKLIVRAADSGRVAVASALSAARLPARQLSLELMAYALNRNSKIVLPAWEMDVQGNTVTFAASYCILIDGLDANLWKYICEATIKEVIEFDSKLRASGLL